MGFDGFISYSHAADGQLAPAVQRGLHRLAKPWHRRRALWIFRDQTGLAVTPALWTSIQQALDGSKYFVLMASPEAARSPWVNREIEHWVATKSADKILPVVTDGEWRWDAAAKDFDPSSTAVPAALRGVFGEEPLYLDLRWARNDVQLSLRHSRFRDAIAQLAAPMHGLSKDELEGEDVRQHRRVRRVWSVGVASLVVLALVASLTGVLAVRNAGRANTSAAEAQRQERAAAEQRGSAERFAEKAREQEEVAKREEARAKAAGDEARRQEQLAAQQKGLAGQAAAEAGRQQENARRQQGLGDAAAARAREQERAAQQQREVARGAVAETARQKEIAQQQQRLAEQAAAVTREQEQIARDMQRLAEEATKKAQQQEQIAKDMQQLAKDAEAEMLKQKANAEEQQRIAISRRLTTQAKATMGRDPKTALMLGAAAQKVQPDAETRRDITGLIRGTHHAGIIPDVTGVAYGSNGVLATMSEDGQVSLWNATDPAKPDLLAKPENKGSPAVAYALSADGRTLVTSHQDGRVVVWSLANPTRPDETATLPRDDALTTVSMALSVDARTLAMYDHDATAEDRLFSSWSESLWDLTDRSGPKRLFQRADSTNSRHEPASFLFSHDGRTMATTSNAEGDGSLSDVTDPAHPVQLDWFGKIDPAQSPLTFSPVADILVVADIGTMTLWDLAPDSRGWLSELKGHVVSAAFSPDGRTLAAADADGKTTLWNVSDPEYPVRLADVTGHGSVTSMAWSPDGTTLVTTGGFATARLWRVKPYGAPEPFRELIEEHASVVTTAFSQDGHTMATTGADGTIFWDMTNPAHPVRRDHTPSLDGGSFARTAFSRDLRTAASAGGDEVTVTDVTHPTRPRTLFHEDLKPEDLTWGVTGLVLSPDARTLAIGADRNRVMIWAMTDQGRFTRLGTVPYKGKSIALSPDGRTLAVDDTAKTVALWDLTSRPAPVKVGKVAGDVDLVGPVAFSPDGGTLATGHSDRTAMLWDVTDRAAPHQLAILTGSGAPRNYWQQHGPRREEVSTLALSADGATLVAVSGDDAEAVLWDIAVRTNPIQLATFAFQQENWMRNPYYSAALSPDGRTLAISGESDRGDGLTSLWDYTKLNDLRADPAKQACAITGRGLTAEEWASYIPDFPYQPTCAA